MRTSHVIYEGDQVWLDNKRKKKRQSPKLQNHWETPYTLVERLSDVTYRINASEKTKPSLVDFNQLWKYHRNGQYTWDQYHQEPSIAGSVGGDEGTGP